MSIIVCALPGRLYPTAQAEDVAGTSCQCFDELDSSFTMRICPSHTECLLRTSRSTCANRAPITVVTRAMFRSKSASDTCIGKVRDRDLLALFNRAHAESA